MELLDQNAHLETPFPLDVVMETSAIEESNESTSSRSSKDRELIRKKESVKSLQIRIEDQVSFMGLTYRNLTIQNTPTEAKVERRTIQNRV